MAEELRGGGTLAATPAVVPRDEWPEGLRNASHAKAGDPPINRLALVVARSEEVIEAAAAAEKRRWMAERIVSGKRCGARSDDARRLHPSIRPDAELCENEK